jgi:hypothetical protein
MVSTTRTYSISIIHVPEAKINASEFLRWVAMAVAMIFIVPGGSEPRKLIRNPHRNTFITKAMEGATG